jgi:carbon-monoxide dehydrogenase medium subunit
MEYVFAETPKQAVDIARRKSEEGLMPRYIAGGTDLSLQVEEGLIYPGILVDLSGIEELTGVNIDKNIARIGALTTITELAGKPGLPGCLSQGALSIGSPQIRNLATIGGNICTASPCGDTLAPMLVLEAEFHLLSSSGERSIAARDFFLGPKQTVLKEDELLLEIRIDKKALEGASAFRKIGKRNGQVISQVNAAVWLKKEEGSDRILDLRAAVGSVAPTPLRLLKVEELFRGKTVDEALLKRAGDVAEAEIKPISDVRSTMEYRSSVTRSLLRDAIEDVLRSRL